MWSNNKHRYTYLITSITLLFGLMFVPSALADKFESDASYSVCFTPGHRCATRIVNQINKAQDNVEVLAYSFTSKPIAEALVKAYKRGVTVEVILDKSQSAQEKYSSSKFLHHAGIPVWIDYKPSISHNKVMIIDGKTTITGSFNFTRSAQSRNAENVLIIHDKKLAKRYTENWHKRKSASMTLSDYQLWNNTTRTVKKVDKFSKSLIKTLKRAYN